MNKNDKAYELRAKIANAAIKLFLAEGFNQITVDAIAAAAGVSRRNLFRYFASKEDIAIFWTEITGPELVNQLHEHSEDIHKQPVQAALDAVIRHVDQHNELHQVSLAMGNLIENTPSLRARNHEKYLSWEGLMADALIEKGTDPILGKMAAAIALAGLRLAVKEWLACQGSKPIADILKRVYEPFINIKL